MDTVQVSEAEKGYIMHGLWVGFILKDIATCSCLVFFLLHCCFCSANATAEFGGRGGDELGMELSNTLYKLFDVYCAMFPRCILYPCQIGYYCYTDVGVQKEVCSVVSLIISVTHKGTVTCVRKVGGGSLDPESIFEMTETGKQVGKAILMKLLQKEESLGKKRQKYRVGPLGHPEIR
uniref:Exoribonuclease phosphorolytic domain-containing protein n=1 Tax=Salmo trutta TaxID=8032 RepID=A0A674BS42_SALTR